MYNLNVDLAASAANAVNSLLSESGGNTPRTPEILNSLIAMTSPLDDLQFADGMAIKKASAPDAVAAASPSSAAGGAAAGAASSCDSNSSSSGCGSAADSPCGSNPPSVQHTCSQLIKAGLKLTIEQKRKLHSRNGDEDLLDLDKTNKRTKRDASESEEDRIKLENGLTPEDEERRRRRRERNKIAATKCRLKKRERTANLVHESETLETQNVELKQQVQRLQSQQRSLMEILSAHRPLCRHNIGPVTRDHLLPPVSSVLETHNYSRPSSVEPAYTTSRSHFGSDSYTVNCRPSSVDLTFSARAGFQNDKIGLQPPSIIVEEVNESYEFTDLDDYSYASPCHNYQSYNSNTTGMDNGCMA